MPISFAFPAAVHFPGSPRIYHTVTPPLATRSAALRAKFAVPVGATHRTSLDQSAQIWSSPNGRLEVYAASSSARWQRSEAPRPSPTAPCTVNAAQAVLLAEQFLIDHDLWRTPDGTPRVTPTLRTVAGVAEPTIVEQTVAYRFALDGIGVLGPGATTAVTIEGDGVVTALRMFWRQAGAAVLPPPSVSFSDAEVLVRRWGDRQRTRDPLLPQPVAPRISFGYLTTPPRSAQPFLFPAFVFEWTPPAVVGRPAGPPHMLVVPAMQLPSTATAPFASLIVN